MSWLSSRTGIHINSINDLTSGRAFKEAARNPLVWAAAAPVLGGAASAGLGAVRRVLGRGGAAAAGGAAGAIGSGTVDPNDPFGSYGQPSSGGGGWLDSILSGVKRVIPSALGGGGGTDLTGLAMGGLAGYQALNAAKSSARAGKLSDKALGLAESQWAAGAPLRSAGQEGLLTPRKVNLSDVYRDPSNPFARRR